MVSKQNASWQLGWPGIASQKDCFPFMDLPPELRLKVYNFLLSTEYTREYRTHPDRLLPRRLGHHYYHFHTSILLTSKKVFSEANDVLYHTNSFVTFQYSHPSVLPITHFETKAKSVGLPIVARGEASRRLAHLATKIIWTPSRAWQIARREPEEMVENTFTFASQDMAAWCTVLLNAHLRWRLPAGGAFLDVKLGPRVFPATLSSCETTPIVPLVERLLEPLRGLHSMDNPRITGPVSREYAQSLIADLTRQPPTSEEIIHDIHRYLIGGDHAAEVGHLALAASKYEATIHAIYRLNEGDNLDDHHLYKAFTLGFLSTGDNTVYKLYCSLARLHLKLKDHQEALAWAIYPLYQVIHEPQFTHAPLEEGAYESISHILAEAAKGAFCTEKAQRQLRHWLSEQPKNTLMQAESQKMEAYGHACNEVKTPFCPRDALEPVLPEPVLPKPQANKGFYSTENGRWVQELRHWMA